MSASMVASYAQHPIGSTPRNNLSPLAPISHVSLQPFNSKPPSPPRFPNYNNRNPNHLSTHQHQRRQPPPPPSSHPSQQLSQSIAAKPPAHRNNQPQPVHQQVYALPTSNAAPNSISQPSSNNTMTTAAPPNMNPNNNLYGAPARRTLSNSTNSTTSSRRSSSVRSSQPAPTSYVALLRKQKATVWCDRSQAEDPRIMAAQRLARERAQREIALAPNSKIATQTINRTPPSSTAGSFTSGVARKIRHHGAHKPAPFSGGNLAGAGVPLRMLASEVDDDGTGKDDWGVSSTQPSSGSATTASATPTADPSFLSSSSAVNIHQRSASGRSSLGSAGGGSGSSGLRVPGGPPPVSASGRYGSSPSTASVGGAGNGSSPTSSHNRSPSELAGGAGMADVREEKLSENYFDATRGGSGSGSESERERKEDELRRRGSVDDRTMTMSGAVRLYIANPDADD